MRLFLRLPQLSTITLALLALTGCNTSKEMPAVDPEVIGESPVPGFLNGYLAPQELPDSATLLPAPPQQGSAQYQRDLEHAKAYLAFQGTSREQLATADAQLHFPQAALTFSCALGIPIDANQTPHINTLMRRTLTDAGLAVNGAKVKYQRERPFMILGNPICTPDEEVSLRADGSYPSGHSAVGWTWAQTLALIAPERRQILEQRGLSFMQSRGICGVHWLSDMESGKVIGAATIEALQHNAQYQAQLTQARAEYAQAKQQGISAPDYCAQQDKAQESSTKLAPKHP